MITLIMHQKIRLWTCVQLFRSIFKYIRFSYYSDKEMYCVCFSLINVLSSLQIVSHFFRCLLFIQGNSHLYSFQRHIGIPYLILNTTPNTQLNGNK